MDHCRLGNLGALPNYEHKHRQASDTDERQYQRQPRQWRIIAVAAIAIVADERGGAEHIREWHLLCAILGHLSL